MHNSILPQSTGIQIVPMTCMSNTILVFPNNASPFQLLQDRSSALAVPQQLDLPVQQRDGRDIVTNCVSTTSNQITGDTKSHNLSRITLCWAQL